MTARSKAAAEPLAADDYLPSIVTLRPAADTTDAIGEAFDRLLVMRSENAAEIERLTALRPNMLMTSTPAAIEATDTRIRQRGVLSEQLDVMEAELRRQFPVAQAREEDAAFAEKLATYRNAAAIWCPDFAARYSRLATEMAELLKAEQAIHKHLDSLEDQPGSRRRGDYSTIMELRAGLPQPCLIVPANQLPSAAPFASAVRLPGRDPRRRGGNLAVAIPAGSADREHGIHDRQLHGGEVMNARHFLYRPLALLMSDVLRVRAFMDEGAPRAVAPVQARDVANYGVVGGVAVVPVVGSLTHGSGWGWADETPYSEIRAMIAHALANTEAKAVALHINSPGGDVAGCFDLADAIYSMRGSKPIWAILDENAYSAAYALASACDRITVPRTGGTGSIGVLVLHTDITGALDQAGVKITTITYGRQKDDGSPTKPLMGAALVRIQAQIDQLGELFVAQVARNRKLSVAAVRGMEAGTFMGAEGVKAGLADEVASPDEAFIGLLATLPRQASASVKRMSKEIIS